MNKLKTFLLFALMLPISVLFCACNEEVVWSAKFTQAELEMDMGEQIRINDYLDLANCDLGDLTVVSSNSEIVFVKENKYLIALKDGVANIMLDGISGAVLCVTVKKEETNLVFETPTNIYYDEKTESVVWDPVYLNNTIATYSVVLTKNGEAVADISEVLTTNKLKVVGYGSFSVKVACRSVENIGGSEFSEEFKFVKLQGPTNLVYNDVNQNLTWEAPAGVDYFRVVVNGVASPLLTQKQYSLNLTEEKTYSIKVMSCAGGEDALTFGKTSDETLTLTRLVKPNLKTNNGAVEWQDKIAPHYLVKVDNQTPITIDQNGLGKYLYNLPGVSAGTHSVVVQAIGSKNGNLTYANGEHYLNSALNETSVEKLPSYELVYEKATKTIKVVNYNLDDGLKFILNVTKDGSSVGSYLMTNGEYVWNAFDNNSTYGFSVVNVSQEDNQINSDEGPSISVVKLGNVTGTSHLLQGDKYFVRNYSTEEATSYVVELVCGGERIIVPQGGLNISDLSSNGTYIVVITAFGTDTINKYFESTQTVTSIKVIKPSKLEPVNNAPAKTIIISEDAESYTYDYVIYNADGQECQSGILPQKEFDYSTLGAGLYKIKARVKEVIGESTAILTGEWSELLEFNVIEQLRSPQVALVNKNELQITNVNNAQKYHIFKDLANETIKIVDAAGGETTSLNIEDLLCNLQSGELLSLYIKALNVDYGTHLTASEPTEIKIKKLTTALTFDYENQVVSCRENELGLNEALIKVEVNGDEVAEINLEEENTVTIQKIAKTEAISTTQGMVYFIDSDAIGFKLVGLTTQIDFDGEKLTYKCAESIEVNPNRTITVKQKINNRDVAIGGTGLDVVNGLLQSHFDENGVSNISVQHVVKYTNCVITSNSTYYITSKSTNIFIKNANEELGITVEEDLNDREVILSWNAKTGATYRYNAEECQTNELKFGCETFEANVENKYLLEEVEPIRTIYIFTIKRVENVESFIVSGTGDVRAKNKPQDANKLVLDTILTEIADNDEHTVYAWYEACEAKDYNKFYLNSNKTEFKFQRKTTLDEALVNNDAITWTETGSVTDYSYKIEFIFNDNEAEEKQLALSEAKIDLRNYKADYGITNESGLKNVKIFKKSNEYEVSGVAVNYLVNEEKAFNITTQPTPTNVTISIVDSATTSNVKLDNKIKISWDMPEGTYSNYIIKINGSNKVAISNVSKSDGSNTYEYEYTIENNYFSTAGVWSVEVCTVGNAGALTSNYSEAATITRLAQVQNLVFDKNTNTISWGGIDDAECEYVVVNKSKGITFAATPTTSFTAGNVEDILGDIVVYAFADGCLNSVCKTAITISRATAPGLNVTNSSLTINNWAECSANSSIYLIIEKFNGASFENVSTIELTGNSHNTLELLESLDVVSETTIKFKLYAQSNDANTITSEVIEKIATLLPALQNFGVVRDAGKLYLVADVNSISSTNVKLVINNSAQDGFVPVVFGKIRQEIDSNVLSLLGKNWTISAYLVGNSIDPLLDSKCVELSGTILDQTTSITTNEDQSFSWDAVGGITKYEVLINESLVDGYNELDTSISLCDYAAGNYTITIKAIGNVLSELKTEDIVLDSLISNEFNVTKIGLPTNIAVTNGYIGFTVPNGANASYAVLYSLSEELLGTYLLEEKTQSLLGNIKYFTNANLMSEISVGGQFKLRFYFTNLTGEALTNAYIKSDITSDCITVQTISQKGISFGFAQNGEETDYDTTLATFNLASGIDSGYILAISHNGFKAQQKIDALTAINQNLNFLNGLVVKVTEDKNVVVVDSTGGAGEGDYVIQYTQLGSSGVNLGGIAYLTYTSETKTIKKLQAPTIEIQTVTESGKNLAVFVNNGVAGYNDLGGIEYYYALQNNQNLAVAQSGILTGAGIIYPNELLSAGEYTFKIKTISKNVDYLPSNYNQKIMRAETPVDATVKKVQAPSSFTLTDGYLYWTVDDLSLGLLSGGALLQTPFTVCLSNLFDSTINIKFELTDESDEYVFTDKLYKYVKLNTNQKIIIKNIVETTYDGSDKDEIIHCLENISGGFPSLNYGFKDFAWSLPAGTYNVSVMQNGGYFLESGTNIYACLSSNYSDVGTYRVYAAPEISIISENGSYFLHFNSVGAISHNVVGINTDGRRSILATVAPSAVNDRTTVNLSELVQNGTLTNEFTSLYVYVQGDNSVLNGKWSNELKINVLQNVSLSVYEGAIKWNQQQGASKYLISYQSAGDFGNVDVENITGRIEYFWEGSGLDSNETYTATITACGDQIATEEYRKNGIICLSGPTTEMGTIIKLGYVATENNGLALNYGIYDWDDVTNATGYFVYYGTSELTLFGLPSESSNIDFVTESTYETRRDEEMYYYYIKTRGTNTSDQINSGTTTYLNSDIKQTGGAYCYDAGQRVNPITNLKMQNGLITFTQVNNDVTYKLTCYKGATSLDPIYIVNDNGTIKVNGVACSSGAISIQGTTWKVDINEFSELKCSGEYTIKIQACYENATATEDGYYLISIAEEISFTKLPKVYDIQVADGKISWAHNSVEDADYIFELLFTYDGANEVKKYVEKGINECSEVIYEYRVEDKEITLQIKVIPAETSVSDNYEGAYAISSTVTYANTIRQFNQIDSSSIVVAEQRGENDETYIVLDWAGPEDDDGSGAVGEKLTYEIEYNVNGTTTTQQFTGSMFTIGKQVDAENNAQVTIGGDVFKYKIRVIPTEENVISSAWSEEKEFATIIGLDEIQYDEVADTYYWTQAELADGSYEYLIRYEVGSVIDEDFVANHTYYISAEISDTMFTPFIWGWHRVSVAIRVKGSAEEAEGGSSLISSYAYVEEVTSSARMFNLFDGGDGTEANPYRISSPDQFKNIEYRLKKDAKNKTVSGFDSDLYYFVQTTTRIEITDDYTIAGEFNGLYDGGKNALTYNWERKLAPLFESVGPYGELKNINLFFNFELKNDSGVYECGESKTISVLTSVNKGTINNIKIGEGGSELQAVITGSQKDFDFVFVARTNYGTIESVVNYYDVTFGCGSDGSLQGTIKYYSISAINRSEDLYTATISKVKNMGNISISATNIYVAGIVGSNYATVEHGANVGNIYAYTNDDESTVCIGGIVAQNNGGTISTSYVSGDITACYGQNGIDGSALNIGGLIGLNSSGVATIEHSYTNLTINQCNNATAISEIYLIAGSTTSGATITGVGYVVVDEFKATKDADSNIYDKYIACEDLSEVETMLTTDIVGVTGSGKPFITGDLTLLWETEFNNLWK